MPETIGLLVKYASGTRIQRYSSLIEIIEDGTSRAPKPGSTLAQAIQWLMSNDYEPASSPLWLDGKGGLSRRQRLSFRRMADA